MVFLIGYMAAGKSTLAEMLHQVHGWPVVDTDQALEARYGRSCAEMIAGEGMEAFRRKEKTLLTSLKGRNGKSPFKGDLEGLEGLEGLVVATGGGMPCWEDNLRLMKQLGTVVYLKWSAEMLTMRLFLTDRSQRPLIAGKNREETLEFVRRQLQEREPYYRQADWTLECDALSDYGIYKKFLEYDNRRN